MCVVPLLRYPEREHQVFPTPLFKEDEFCLIIINIVVVTHLKRCEYLMLNPISWDIDNLFCNYAGVYSIAYQHLINFVRYFLYFRFK